MRFYVVLAVLFAVGCGPGVPAGDPAGLHADGGDGGPDGGPDGGNPDGGGPDGGPADPDGGPDGGPADPDGGPDDGGPADLDGGPGDGGPDGGFVDGGSADAGPSPAILARPYTLHVPAGWDKTTPAPVLLMFHGYGSNGADHENYLKFAALSDAKGFLYAYADGTVDSTYRRFWNGTDACCDVFFKGIDDVAYAAAILDDVARQYPVDPKRVYAFGHSNGGFMVHRLACDLADRFAAVASLAGAVYKDASKCKPKNGLAVLQIHADTDQTILYAGGKVTFASPEYPGARTTVATWAVKNGCGLTLADTGTRLDLDTNVAGAETRVEGFGAGCPVELWTMTGGSHMPKLPAGWSEPVWAFFAAHPKP